MNKTRTFTCIMCPNSCTIETVCDEQNKIFVSGNHCGKGKEYVLQELINPVRTVTTTIPIENGDIPLCSVKLTKAIPKAAIPNVIREIHTCKIKAPAHIGQVLIHHVCGYDSDVVVTKNIDKLS